MASLLESIDWRKNAIEHAKHIHQLDPKKPAFIHIRHSERPQMEVHKEAFKMPLSPRGEKAAYEFGLQLPNNRHYHFYYTDMDRTKVTAEMMQKGIQENNGSSEIIDEIPLFTILNYEEAGKIIRKMNISDDVLRAKTLFYRWISGIYPPEIINPSPDFSQEAASIMLKTFETAKPSDMFVWVTHENWIAAFLMQWLGEWSFDWIPFLDGFTLQLYDDYMAVYYRGEKKEIRYPYWWHNQK
jgi:broad specificity phosphatase PhoE